MYIKGSWNVRWLVFSSMMLWDCCLGVYSKDFIIAVSVSDHNICCTVSTILCTWLLCSLQQVGSTDCHRSHTLTCHGSPVCISCRLHCQTHVISKQPNFLLDTVDSFLSENLAERVSSELSELHLPSKCLRDMCHACWLLLKFVAAVFTCF